MSITNFTELSAAVANWLARDDLTARVPEFIRLAEVKFNRELRSAQMEIRSYANVNLDDDEPEFIALPTDFQTMRRVRMSNQEGKPRLNFLSGEQMDEYRASIGNVAGTPRYFTVFGTEMEMCPTPNTAITLEMVYRGTIPALSAGNGTNWLLTAAPDLYLYGALLEASIYNREDPRIPVWSAGMAAALEGLNRLSTDALYGAGPLSIRITGPTF